MHRSRRSPLLGAAFVICVSFAMPSPAEAQDAALIKKGQDVYDAQKCAVCHSVAGKGSKTNPLDGVGAKLSSDDIHAWITDPVAMTTGWLANAERFDI
jgi:mono/diheme cytochrome c family protein